MQSAIHRTDQSKLFPVIVLLEYARLPYASYCAILGCFVQIRTSSVALRHGFELRLESLALRLDRIGWMPAQCERHPALVLGDLEVNRLFPSSSFIRLKDDRRVLASVYEADFPEPRLWTLSSSSYMS
jgi:hypothetical protein